MKIDPNININWLIKGNQLFNLKEYYYAEDFYKEAIKTDPKAEIDWINKGNTLFD